MHISSVHKHGAQTADTSLHFDVVSVVVDDAAAADAAPAAILDADAANDDVANDFVGNDCTACIRLDIDEPENGFDFKYKNK